MASMVIDITPIIQKKVGQIVRDALISDIGELWDDYCYDNNVPPEIKLHGIEFLEHFAKQLNKEL